jgi:nitrite reductase/ring-hydroxylating ferredoxin subunit
MIVERTRWHPIRDVRVASLAEDGLLRVMLKNHPIVLVRHSGSLYAFADRCPHQGKPLNGGWVDEGHLVCPYHRFHFKLENGHARHGVCSHATVYEVKSTADGCAIGIPYTTFRIFGFDLW